MPHATSSTPLPSVRAEDFSGTATLSRQTSGWNRNMAPMAPSTGRSSNSLVNYIHTSTPYSVCREYLARLPLSLALTNAVLRDFSPRTCSFLRRSQDIPHPWRLISDHQSGDGAPTLLIPIMFFGAVDALLGVAQTGKELLASVSGDHSPCRPIIGGVREPASFPLVHLSRLSKRPCISAYHHHFTTRHEVSHRCRNLGNEAHVKRKVCACS